MFNEIETYETRFINLNFTGDQYIKNVNLNIPFEIDEFVIKYVSLSINSAAIERTSIYKLDSSIINKTLFTFVGDITVMNENLNIPFKLKSTLDNTYTFTLKKSTENFTVGLGVGEYINISLCLLFIKYKK